MRGSGDDCAPLVLQMDFTTITRLAENQCSVVNIKGSRYSPWTLDG